MLVNITLNATTVCTVCACTKRLDETQWTETRDEIYWAETETYCSDTETRLEKHRSATETRPRRSGFCPRRDQNVSMSRDRLETKTSRPRPHP